eukprot:2108576-Rhodomonas_salina.3
MSRAKVGSRSISSEDRARRVWSEWGMRSAGFWRVGLEVVLRNLDSLERFARGLASGVDGDHRVGRSLGAVSYTHLRAHETEADL